MKSSSSLSRREKLLLGLLTSTLVFSASFSYGAVNQAKVDSIMKMITDGGAKFSDIPVSGQTKSERTSYYEKVDAGLGDAVEMLAVVRNNIRSLMGLSPAYTADDIVGSILGGVMNGVGGTSGGNSNGNNTDTGTSGNTTTLTWSLPSASFDCPKTLVDLRTMSSGSVSDVNPNGFQYYKSRSRDFYANVLDHNQLPGSDLRIIMDNVSPSDTLYGASLPDTCSLGQKWVSFADEVGGVCRMYTCESVSLLKVAPAPTTGSIATTHATCENQDFRFGFPFPEIASFDFREKLTGGLSLYWDQNPYSTEHGPNPGSPNYAFKIIAGNAMTQLIPFGAMDHFKEGTSYLSIIPHRQFQAWRNAFAREEQEFSLSKCKGEFDPAKSLVGDNPASDTEAIGKIPKFYATRQGMIDAVNDYLQRFYHVQTTGGGFAQVLLQVCPKNGIYVQDDGSISDGDPSCHSEVIRIPYPITLANYRLLDPRILQTRDVGDMFTLNLRGSAFGYTNLKEGESAYLNISPKKNIAARYKDIAILYDEPKQSVLSIPAGPRIAIKFGGNGQGKGELETVTGRHGKDTTRQGQYLEASGMDRPIYCNEFCRRKP